MPNDLSEFSDAEEFYRYITEHSSSIRIVDDIINVKDQEQFLRLARKIKPNKVSNMEALRMADRLFETDVTIPEAKKILVILALRSNIEAFRVIEKYKEVAPPKLQDFARFSFYISRTLVEGDLSDNPPSLISTGLGGKNNKLRMFIAIFPSFEVLSVKIKPELSEWNGKKLQKLPIETEKLHFLFEYTSLRILVPLNIDLTDVIKEFINECNKYGNFIFEGFFATNVTLPTHREILTAIEKVKNQHS
jgi:hypothetical protein